MAGVLAASGVGAQEAEPPAVAATNTTPRQTVSVVGRVSITETLTSNVRLLDADLRQSDRITDINPGVHVNVAGSRLKASFDYSVNELLYAHNSSSRHVLHNLNSTGSLEAVDNWAFLDFGGAVAQQAISAFGPQSTAATSINANQTEVSNYRISPYLKGRIGNAAAYQARLSYAITRSAANAASNVNSSDGSLQVGSLPRPSGLGWSVQASRQTNDYTEGRSTTADRLRLSLPYAVTPQLSAALVAGRESDNYTSLSAQGHGTGGFDITWSPSDLSHLTASIEQRSFGQSHKLSFESRSARTVWKFSDTQDASTAPVRGTVSGSIYDLLFSQFAAAQPDPIARAQMVNAYLQANGLAGSTVATSGFLTSSLSLLRQQDLSLALLGVRDTITFIATRGQTSKLDALSPASGDLASTSQVQQRGFSASLGHRLTPDYSLAVLASGQASAGGSQSTRLRSLNVNLTGKVGSKSALTLGARRVVSSGTTPYAESAVTGNLNVSF